MDILKVLITFAESGKENVCDAILLENHVWLVGKWLENKELKISKPIRIIRLPESDIEASQLDQYHFLLLKPIPQSVLDGRATHGYEVRESPDLMVSMNPLSPSLH